MVHLPKLLLFSVATFLLLAITQSGKSQNILKVHGVILDSKDRSPLRGVVVQEANVNNQAVTDANGKFELTTHTGSRLIISLVGYKTLVLKAAADMSVVMETNAVNLDDVVVVGYGTQKKELLTGSLATVKFKESDVEEPTTMLGNSLAGKMAGVNVNSPSGLPGTAPAITIRTANSFNSQPVVYVIDGKVMGSGDFNNLSPNEIESITVLKDAASAAVYGSRAAGGVILVTTKKGVSGKTRFQYSFNTGEDTRTKNVSLTSAVQAGKLYMQINPTSDPAGWAWTQSDYDYFNKMNNGWGYNQLATVWRNPYTLSHNLSASGGDDKVRYFIGGSYVHQNGFLQTLAYDKYNVRANLTANVSRDWEVFGGFTLNNNITHSTTNTPIGDPNGIYAKLLVWQPDEPTWTNTGKPIDYGWIGNMGAETNGTGGYVNSYGIKPVINLSTTYKAPFLKGLSAKASFSKSYADNRTKYFQRQYTQYTMRKATIHQWATNDSSIVSSRLSSQVSQSYMQENATWSEDKQLDLQLNYERTFGSQHHVKGWLIYEGYEASGSGMSAGINGFPVYTTDQWWAASTNAANSYVSNSTTYSDYQTGRKSWVGQFFYDYAGKYLANLTYRYDGSMNFAPSERWGFFPSASGGWIISKESFFKSKAIDLLKVRGSVGLVGNDNIGGWQWQQSYVAGNSAYFGTTPATKVGITYGGVVNPNLTWEKSLNKNVGVDINFLKHFSGSVDYWYTNTYDILGAMIQHIPPTFSRTLPAANYGKVNAEGVDVSLGYGGRIGQVMVHTSVVGSYGNAWYVKQDQNITYDWQRNAGRSTTKITGYKVAGMIRTQADLTAFTSANPNYTFNGFAPQLGQLVYQDLNSANGQGTKDGKVDNYDQTILRKNNNPINFGWNLGAEWKGFSIDATFNGMVRQWKSYGDLAGGVEWNRVWSQWATNSWTAANPNAYLPKRYSAIDGTSSVNTAGSNFWYRNASFLRLKYLNVAYSIPAKYAQRAGFDNIKLYFSGTNMFIVSKFNKNYYDPEMGGGTAFPIMRSYNAGVNVSF